MAAGVVLNEQQRRAVEHGDGPLLVVAGAGTGKTGTLAARVAHLLAGGVAPERILLLTFTRRAAQEMLVRAGRLSDPRAAGRVWGGTFHAVANRLLRAHAGAVGLAPGFTVLDQADAADVLQLVRAEVASPPPGAAPGRRRGARKETLAAIHSRVVNTQTPLSEVVRRDFPWCTDEVDVLRAVFGAYAERKRDQDVVDFDDLLLLWLAAASSPTVGPAMAGRFDHVLVDEYQDTNALQARIVAALRIGHPNVMAVGDDAQAVYSFRGATVDNILRFPADFPGTTVVTLEQNYRSAPPVLDLANAVLAARPEGHGHAKALWSQRPARRRPELVTCADEGAQCAAVCERVLDHVEDGVRLQRQAVLFRAGHHSDALELELARRNIPFVKYGGLRFLEAAHVKDLLALLRIADNPADEPAWFRVLLLLEGVGPATARRLLADLGVRPRSGGRSPLERLGGDVALPGPAEDAAAALSRALVDCVRPHPALTPAAQVERLAEALAPVVRRRYDGAEARLGDLAHLAGLATGASSRSRLLADLTLDPPAATGDLAGPPGLDEDWLVLSTVHSAKGMEWDVVHVIHAADGMFPSDMALGDRDGVEEERRLFYVALTRARDHLHLYHPLRYHHHRHGLDDAHGYAPLTRFLPPNTHHLVERSAAGVAEAADGMSGAPTEGRSLVGTVDRQLAALFDG